MTVFAVEAVAISVIVPLPLFFSTSFEFQFKILAAEKGVKFLVPEFLLAHSVIKHEFDIKNQNNVN